MGRLGWPGARQPGQQVDPVDDPVLGRRRAGRTLAAIVAENAAVEALISPEPPTLGEVEGQVRLGDQDWIWRRTTAPADQGLLRIDIRVLGVSEPRTLAEVTIFRGGA